MIQLKNPNAVIAEDSLHAASTFAPFQKKKRSNENIYILLIELLYAPNGAYLPQLPMKAIPLAESPATASHMIQRNPGKKEKKVVLDISCERESTR